MEHIVSQMSFYNYTTKNFNAVLWFRQLVAGLSQRSPGFVPGSMHVGFVADKVALGQDFL